MPHEVLCCVPRPDDKVKRRPPPLLAVALSMRRRSSGRMIQSFALNSYETGKGTVVHFGSHTLSVIEPILNNASFGMVAVLKVQYVEYWDGGNNEFFADLSISRLVTISRTRETSSGNMLLCLQDVNYKFVCMLWLSLDLI